MANNFTIYTKGNWQLLNFTFPNGTMKGDSYTVFLDNGDYIFNERLTKLKKISPYLAQVILDYSDTNGITFIKGF